LDALLQKNQEVVILTETAKAKQNINKLKPKKT